MPAQSAPVDQVSPELATETNPVALHDVRAFHTLEGEAFVIVDLEGTASLMVG